MRSVLALLVIAGPLTACGDAPADVIHSEVVVTPAPASTVTPTPPASGRIVFASDRDGDYDLYVMDADGGNVQPLTDDAGWDSDPAWSPDGNRIAFKSDRDGDSDIYVMDADGGNVRQLTDDPGWDEYPAWSPA